MQKQAIPLCVLAATLLLSEFGVLAYKECTAERGGDLQKCYKSLQEQLDSLQTRVNELSDRLNNSHQLMESNEKRLPELQRIEHQLRNKTLNPCPGARGTGRKELWLAGRSEPVPVWCAMTAFDGGWLVIQQRLDGTESFLRGWESYREGFGTVGHQKEFWLGLELVHQLTKCCRHELVVEVRNVGGDYRFVRYDDFGVDDEEEEYALKVLGRVNGTLADGLALKSSFLVSEKIGEDGEEEGGWWVNSRVASNLNAAYRKGNDGMRWAQLNWDIAYSRMMIRPGPKCDY